VRCQQRVRARWPLIGLPVVLLQATPNGLAVEIESSGDLSDRQPLVPMQPVDLLPAVFLDHALLLKGQSLKVHGPIVTNRVLHLAPPQALGGDFSVTLGGELCMTADNPDQATRNPCADRPRRC